MRRAIAAVAIVSAVSLAPAVVHGGVEEPIYAIDSPTAGLLGDGEYMLQGRVGPESSIHLGGRIGFFNVFHVGVSFGIQRVFERDDPSVNDQVGFQVRVRVIEELATPAFAVGFNSQGVGRYDEDADRYERKSPGFYGVLSRNWRLALGQASVHGGLNYSLETDDEKGLDVFAALDWMPVSGFSLLLDADGALDDNEEDGAFGGGGIYLDAAIRVNYGENLSMMLVFRDLTGNYEPVDTVGREFELALYGSF